jgi:hypothetical protein
MPQHEDKSCAKCGSIFECKLGSITICHCFDVPLNREETLYMVQNYDDCLCHYCLVEEKENFKKMKDSSERINNTE